MGIKSLSIRIDDRMLNKLHVVADYEGRSANSEILILQTCYFRIADSYLIIAAKKI